MSWRFSLVGWLILIGFGCNDTVASFVFDARIVDGEGGNPAAGTDATTLRIGIQEGELPAQEFEYAIVDGDFDAVLELAAFTRPTRVRVAIEGPTTELLTAPPEFVPGASGGILRVVTSAPSSCERVTFDFLESPRAFFGMVPSGTFALVVGGTTPADEQIEFFDALEWEARLFSEDLSVADLGETRAASIDAAEILVLPSQAAPFVFNMQDATGRITPVVLHNGAGPRSALVSVPGVGAMVIGGEVAGEAQSAVSLVAPGGAVSSLGLSEARSGPQATALGANVLVAGGNDAGTAEILLEDATRGRSVDGVMDGMREGGLLVGDGQSRALWMGGTDASDTLRQDTLRFDACPDACVSSAGPEWTTARVDALQPPQTGLIIGGAESTLVEEVRWESDPVAIQRLLELNVPRAGAGGMVLESGAFIVAGGDDGVSIREDFEFCVPSSLEPL